MKFRPLLFAAIVAVFLVPVGAAGKDDAPAFESLRLMHAIGTLVVEPDGSASTVRIDSKMTDALRAAVERTISRMKFKPVLVGGAPQRASSAFDISLAARAIDDSKNYSVTVEGIAFHPVKDKSPGTADQADAGGVSRDGAMKPPKYPGEAEREGVMGRVQLALHFGPDGRVIEAAVVKSMLYDVRIRHDAAALRCLRLFERAALDAARAWRAKLVPGKSQPADTGDFTAMTAVVFTVVKTDLDADGLWLPVRRLPNRPIPWRKDLPADDVSDGGASSGFLALGGGPVELEHPARGTPVL